MDALLMISVLSVLLYFFLMQPMMEQILQRELAEEELRAVNQNLEETVKTRTSELVAANRSLRGAIDEQRATAESLRRNSSFVESVFNRTACVLLAFEASNRRCIYVNGRISDLLKFEQDAFVPVGNDISDLLSSQDDRARFLKGINRIIDDPSIDVVWETLSFKSATDHHVRVQTGLSALDLTPSGQVRSLLLTGVPAVA
ncbi:MAG: hypothetical protein MUC56_15955 [Thermoanaerobaculales bacterium]|nr:hypothetical protein [Thermoanaerobaculales bacterium]